MSVCTDYSGSAFTADLVRMVCGTGTYSADPCPTADRVGSCTIMMGENTEQIVRYYTTGGSPQSDTQAQSTCAGQTNAAYTPG